MTIYDYHCISVTDLNAFGLVRPGRVSGRSLNLTAGRAMSRYTLSLDVIVDYQGKEPLVYLSFCRDGSRRHYQRVPLVFVPSNLKPSSGYYLFVCPETGRRCRNLYLVDESLFVSRSAFRPLYPEQKQSKTTRTLCRPIREIERIDKYENLVRNRKFRKMTYRGKPTVYAERLSRLRDIICQRRQSL